MNTELHRVYSQSSYEDKVIFYGRFLFSGSNITGKLEDKLRLMQLLSLVTLRMRTQEPQITTKEVLERLLKKDLNNPSEGFCSYLLGLAITCDDLLYGMTTIDSLGYTNANDIINEIKRLLDGWIPF